MLLEGLRFVKTLAATFIILTQRIQLNKILLYLDDSFLIFSTLFLLYKNIVFPAHAEYLIIFLPILG